LNGIEFVETFDNITEMLCLIKICFLLLISYRLFRINYENIVRELKELSGDDMVLTIANLKKNK